jgi:hypothetical protein
VTFKFAGWISPFVVVFDIRGHFGFAAAAGDGVLPTFAEFILKFVPLGLRNGAVFAGRRAACRVALAGHGTKRRLITGAEHTVIFLLGGRVEGFFFGGFRGRRCGDGLGRRGRLGFAQSF